jgi:hypothetical protein
MSEERRKFWTDREGFMGNLTYESELAELAAKAAQAAAKITAARITAMPSGICDPLPQVWVVVGNAPEKKLFDFFPDEISFTSDEFVGLTEDEARALKGKKDRAYLRS